MSEKVIHEVRVIETEDGYRIEMKGDKARLRRMALGAARGPGRGPRQGRGRDGQGKGRGRAWRRRQAMLFGPWAWAAYDPESEQLEELDTPKNDG
ncbi:MAG: hypothetical protein U9R25_00050 [Chloroflexota bacterium]|nr:hypothetical protein [Chloroflexota bacterium]